MKLSDDRRAISFHEFLAFCRRMRWTFTRRGSTDLRGRWTTSVHTRTAWSSASRSSCSSGARWCSRCSPTWTRARSPTWSVRLTAATSSCRCSSASTSTARRAPHTCTPTRASGSAAARDGICNAVQVYVVCTLCSVFVAALHSIQVLLIVWFQYKCTFALASALESCAARVRLRSSTCPRGTCGTLTIFYYFLLFINLLLTSSYKI